MIFRGVILTVCFVAVANAGSDLVGDRIVGGSNMDIRQRTFQVGVNPCDHMCGGSLVKLGVVVTAAHCTTGCAASNIFVYAGNNVFGEGQEKSVAVKIDHENYNPKTKDHDISILKLSSPYVASSFIGTIPLATVVPADDTLLTVSGYGDTATNGDVSTQLLSVNLLLKNFAQCNAAYRNSLTSNMFCAAGEGKDSCQGDSGGPITYVSSTGTVFLGVVSFGMDCADPDYPGVYASVPAHSAWIQKNW